jgi:hypothetical protein
MAQRDGTIGREYLSPNGRQAANTGQSGNNHQLSPTRPPFLWENPLTGE